MNLNNNKREDVENYWMVTYSDMITIVLCFFIVLFTISTNETSLLNQIKVALDSKVNLLEDENSRLSRNNEQLTKEKESLLVKLFQTTNIEDEIDNSNEDFIKYLRENGLLNDVDIINEDMGVKIRFKNSILFDSGHAEISSDGKLILDKIGDKIMKIDNMVRIEGFTDNVKTNTNRYASNWELSVDRAINVVKYFVNEKNIREDRMSVIGWGEQNPIATNDTPKGRAQNRRIEITILK